MEDEDYDNDYCAAEGEAWLNDQAYDDCLTYYKREPTEDELEDCKEGLREKYCGRYEP